MLQNSLFVSVFCSYNLKKIGNSKSLKLFKSFFRGKKIENVSFEPNKPLE